MNTDRSQNTSLSCTSAADVSAFVAFSVLNGGAGNESDDSGHVRMCGAFED